MPKRVRKQTLIPKELTGKAREELIEELYAVQNEVFDGVDRDSFVKYVFDSPAEATWIDVFRDEQGRAVAYMALHRFIKNFQGMPCAIFRAEAGALRQFRGQTSIGYLLGWKVLSYLLTHPGRPVYYLGSLVHPSSYHGLSRYVKTIWPNPFLDTPAHIVTFLCDLADEFHLEPANPDNPLVRQVGWCTRDTDAEREYWKTCPKPTVRFFVETNPGYSQGHGLLTLIPFSLGEVIPIIIRFLMGRCRRSMVAIRSTIQRFPGLRPRMTGEAIAEHLRKVPLLATQEETVLLQLAETCEERIAAPGEWIFKQGEAGDNAYIVMRGAVYVIIEGEEEELILDELLEGDIFGEMALLTGATRNASIRSATAVKLLTIRRGSLLHTLDQNPELAEAVWATFDLRSFDSAIREVPQYARLDHNGREAWFSQKRTECLQSQETRTIQGPGAIFLSSGSIQTISESTRVISGAPTLILHDAPQELQAVTPSRLHTLPPPPRPQYSG